MRLDPELAEIVERARKRAIEAGELPLRPTGTPFKSPLSDEAKMVLREWLDGGGYERSLAEIVAEDPELANE
jgi:hypothetical protein